MTDLSLKIREVLRNLDDKNDELWTNAGKVRVDVVDKAIGVEDLTRKDIEDAAPGFMRGDILSDDPVEETLEDKVEVPEEVKQANAEVAVNKVVEKLEEPVVVVVEEKGKELDGVSQVLNNYDLETIDVDLLIDQNDQNLLEDYSRLVQKRMAGLSSQIKELKTQLNIWGEKFSAVHEVLERMRFDQDETLATRNWLKDQMKDRIRKNEETIRETGMTRGQFMKHVKRLSKSKNRNKL